MCLRESIMLWLGATEKNGSQSGTIVVQINRNRVVAIENRLNWPSLINVQTRSGWQLRCCRGRIGHFNWLCAIYWEFETKTRNRLRRLDFTTGSSNRFMPVLFIFRSLLLQVLQTRATFNSIGHTIKYTLIVLLFSRSLSPCQPLVSYSIMHKK